MFAYKSIECLHQLLKADICFLFYFIIYEHLYRIKTFSIIYKIIKNTAINGGP